MDRQFFKLLESNTFKKLLVVLPVYCYIKKIKSVSSVFSDYIVILYGKRVKPKETLGPGRGNLTVVYEKQQQQQRKQKQKRSPVHRKKRGKKWNYKIYPRSSLEETSLTPNKDLSENDQLSS